MAVERFKTLARRDPEFLAYLEGSFSSTHFALPVRSLNVGTQTEEITFEIKETKDVPHPGFVNVAWLLIRPSSLVFSLAPMITVLFFCVSREMPILRFVGVTSLLGVVVFQIAVNLFNDYGDHIKGQDRMRPLGGSRAIQKGLVRARSVKRIAIGLLVVAAILGVPAFVSSLSRAFILAIVAGFLALEFAFQKFRLKARGWAEVFAFILTGPLLAVGYSWAVAEEATWDEVLIGGIFGSIALLYFHSANFENIMVDDQAGALTWATRAGFDASKRFYYFVSGLTLAFTTAYVLLVERTWYFTLVLIVQFLFIIPVCLRVMHLASPLSSRLSGLRSKAIQFSALTAMLLIAAYIYGLVNR